ncbi:DUF11 domain-containing protein [Streptomyces roseicoloratus]|uniref:RCC1 domain-containing protein n=1 Tax=Streptomyces roseicoloratus TaxID=2508722 RepID=UPI0013E915B4|nr:DUF11 domain-containing protein [Streptomyces roseicoloratus]
MRGAGAVAGSLVLLVVTAVLAASALAPAAASAGPAGRGRASADPEGTGQAKGQDHARDIRTGPPGTPLTWGSNDRGQLGDGNTSGSGAVPGRVCGNATCTTALGAVVRVAAAGGHSVGVLDDGGVVAWGANGSGQLGDGTTTDRTTPVRVCAVGETAPCASYLKGVVAVAAGAAHSMALLTDGTVVSWGDNGQGRLGDGTPVDHRASPVRVCAVHEAVPCATYLSGVTALAAGARHSLAVRADGSVASWGLNAAGQLGDGTTQDRPVPVLVSGLTGAVSVAGGAAHSLAVGADGTVRAWGEGDALGDGVGARTGTPVRVCAVEEAVPCTSFLTGVRSVAAGAHHSLAARTDGTVVSWGDNGQGAIGDGTDLDRRVPVQVCAPDGCATKLSGVTQVAAGATGAHSLALRDDGTVRAWGLNRSGQLGDGTRTTGTFPVRVCAAGQSAPCGRLLEGVTSLAGGDTHTVALAVQSADLTASIAASPEPVANGGTLTYTIRVHNHGPTAAANVVLTDHLPGTVRYVSAATTSGHCDTPPTGATDTMTCHFGTLGRGGSASVTLAVKIRTTPGTPVTDTATATSDTPDPNPTNNTSTISTPVS